MSTQINNIISTLQQLQQENEEQAKLAMNMLRGASLTHSQSMCVTTALWLQGTIEEYANNPQQGVELLNRVLQTLTGVIVTNNPDEQVLAFHKSDMFKMIDQIINLTTKKEQA